MALKNTDNSYGNLALFFHWALALLIIGLLIVGLIMGDFEAPFKYKVYGVHKALGIVVLTLVTARLLWRWKNIAPRLPDTMSPFQKLASHAVHIFLYIAMFGMPLSGWAMSSAGGYSVSIFGLFTMPPLLEKNKELGKLFNEIHEYLAYALIAALIVHIGAALIHHFIFKDNIVKRMMGK